LVGLALACGHEEAPRAAASCAIPPGPSGSDERKNVLGEELAPCAPGAGFFRDGYCTTGPSDTGVHVVCARVDRAFLDFTRTRGNDLETPRSGFAGLKPGDRWCLCASRWDEARAAGVAPPIDLSATHAALLRVVPSDVVLAAPRAGTP
jgi:uncharacterized protein (DUF2237 family)